MTNDNTKRIAIVIYREDDYAEVNRVFAEPSNFMSSPELDALDWLYGIWSARDGSFGKGVSYEIAYCFNSTWRFTTAVEVEEQMQAMRKEAAPDMREAGRTC